MKTSKADQGVRDQSKVKPKLAISFSGGRTSAVMTKLCFEKFKDTHEIAVTFANTGCEHENTLRFVDQCDKAFGWNVAWVEAIVTMGKRKGIRAKVVTFETASRNGEPFEAAIEKYGMPDRNHPHCNARLKTEVMYAYLRDELGWKRRSYWSAIGIRADEMDRVSSKRIQNKFLYPLADAGWTKEDVKRECASWGFDLELKGEHYGNCTFCWKKSNRKLMTLAQESPQVFDFPIKMEAAHGWTNNTDTHKRVMFRERRSALDIVELARTRDFTPYSDAELQDGQLVSTADYDVWLDTGSGCGESCEIGADD